MVKFARLVLLLKTSDRTDNFEQIVLHPASCFSKLSHIVLVCLLFYPRLHVLHFCHALFGLLYRRQWIISLHVVRLDILHFLRHLVVGDRVVKTVSLYVLFAFDVFNIKIEMLNS